MSTVTFLEKSQATIACRIEGEKWQTTVKKSAKELESKLNIKGFRPGKVPAHLVPKYLSREEVYLKACNLLANEAYREAVEEHQLNVYYQVKSEIAEANEEACEIHFTVDLYPQVTLGDINGVALKRKKVKVTNEEIDKEVDRLLDLETLEVTKEGGEVVEGDIAIIDFKGFLDGEAFPGGEAQNYSLGIGSKSFIDGFEQQLIGMKAGEDRDITVTFPENYQAENLKGKEVVFKIHLHEIKEKVRPELTDEFASTLTSYEGVAGVEELRAKIKERITENKRSQQEEKLEEEMFTKLLELTSVDLPASMIDAEVENNMRMVKQNVEQRFGVSYDDFLSITGQDKDVILKEQQEQAMLTLRKKFLLSAVIREFKLSLEASEVEVKLQEFVDKGYITEADKKADHIVNYASEMVMEAKTTEMLKSKLITA